jgi:hypothetical protein
MKVVTVYIWRREMKTIAAFGVAAGLLLAAIPTAKAEEVTLARPMDGATLTSDGIAMSLYYVGIDDGGFELVATYIGESEREHPSRIVMRLADGDATAFGLPGYPGMLFEFARTGNVVVIRSKAVEPHGSLAPVAAAG